MMRRNTKSATRSILIASFAAILLLLTIFMWSSRSSNQPLDNLRGSPAVGKALSKSRDFRRMAAEIRSDDVSQTVRLVQAHLKSLRERVQDRPAAPMVLSSSSQHAAGSNPLAPRTGGIAGAIEEDDPKDRDDTIFVSMAAFRDVECAPTLEDMFAKAKYPHRIFVGIVEQRDAVDEYCIPASFRECQSSAVVLSEEESDNITTAASGNDSATLAVTKKHFCPMDNIRFRRTSPTEARGPCFGRFVAQLMYQGERYFMMIDSHNRFVPRWDARLLRMYHQLPTKGILSHYPSAYEPGMVMESNHEIMFMCHAHYYDGGGILRNGAKNVRNKQRRPVLQPFTAAGFLFGVSDYVFDVPFDPYLDYLFDGEEILYTVRLWTHGWDSYLPSHDIMYHFYGRPKAPKVWGTTDQWVAIQRVSQRRVLYILNMTQANSTLPAVDPATETEKRIFMELDKYGLGHERRVDDFWPFAHVDPVKRQSDRGFCDRAN